MDLEQLLPALKHFLSTAILTSEEGLAVQPQSAGRESLLLDLIFNSEEWLGSPLYRKVKLISPNEANLVNRLRIAVDEALVLHPDDDFDMPGHQTRMEIGQEWALLRLVALISDGELMRAASLAALLHQYRAYPLRLQSPVEVGAERFLPRDQGSFRRPLRWKLGPLSVIWIYAACLVWHGLPSNDRVESYGIKNAVQAAARLIYTLAHLLTPGDLALADALITTLARTPGISWQLLAPLARLSPLTRLCHIDVLFTASQLTPLEFDHSMERSQWDTYWGVILPIFTGSDQLPGAHHRASQCLADALQPAALEVSLQEASATMRYLSQPIYKRILEAPETTSGHDYQTGALLCRALTFAHRDGMLEKRLERSSDYLSPLFATPFLKMLYDASLRITPPYGPGERYWINPVHRRGFMQLQEFTYAL